MDNSTRRNMNTGNMVEKMTGRSSDRQVPLFYDNNRGRYVYSNGNILNVKKATGIPRSFCIEVDGPVPGAFLTEQGKFIIPCVDYECYAENPRIQKTNIPREILSRVNNREKSNVKKLQRFTDEVKQKDEKLEQQKYEESLNEMNSKMNIPHEILSILNIQKQSNGKKLHRVIDEVKQTEEKLDRQKSDTMLDEIELKMTSTETTLTQLDRINPENLCAEWLEKSSNCRNVPIPPDDDILGELIPLDFMESISLEELEPETRNDKCDHDCQVMSDDELRKIVQNLLTEQLELEKQSNVVKKCELHDCEEITAIKESNSHIEELIKSHIEEKNQLLRHITIENKPCTKEVNEPQNKEKLKSHVKEETSCIEERSDKIEEKKIDKEKKKLKSDIREINKSVHEDNILQTVNSSSPLYETSKHCIDNELDTLSDKLREIVRELLTEQLKTSDHAYDGGFALMLMQKLKQLTMAKIQENNQKWIVSSEKKLKEKKNKSKKSYWSTEKKKYKKKSIFKDGSPISARKAYKSNKLLKSIIIKREQEHLSLQEKLSQRTRRRGRTEPRNYSHSPSASRTRIDSVSPSVRHRISPPHNTIYRTSPSRSHRRTSPWKRSPTTSLPLSHSRRISRSYYRNLSPRKHSRRTSSSRNIRTNILPRSRSRSTSPSRYKTSPRKRICKPLPRKTDLTSAPINRSLIPLPAQKCSHDRPITEDKTTPSQNHSSKTSQRSYSHNISPLPSCRTPWNFNRSPTHSPSTSPPGCRSIILPYSHDTPSVRSMSLCSDNTPLPHSRSTTPPCSQSRQSYIPQDTPTSSVSHRKSHNEFENNHPPSLLQDVKSYSNLKNSGPTSLQDVNYLANSGPNSSLSHTQCLDELEISRPSSSLSQMKSHNGKESTEHTSSLSHAQCLDELQNIRPTSSFSHVKSHIELEKTPLTLSLSDVHKTSFKEHELKEHELRIAPKKSPVVKTFPMVRRAPRRSPLRRNQKKYCTRSPHQSHSRSRSRSSDTSRSRSRSYKSRSRSLRSSQSCSLYRSHSRSPVRKSSHQRSGHKKRKHVRDTSSSSSSTSSSSYTSESSDSRKRMRRPLCTKVYVTNLPAHCTPVLLQEKFSFAGTVTLTSLMGFGTGTVQYNYSTSAEKAVSMFNQSKFHGNTITVGLYNK